MTSKLGEACAAATFGLVAAQAQAADPVYAAISPLALQDLLKTRDASVALDATTNDAILSARSAALPYDVVFYECDNRGFTAPARPDSDCLGFEYRAKAPFDVPGDDVEVANGWNEVYHFGKVWRDELGCVVIQMNVVVEGGVTARNILATHDRWRRTLASFKTYLETR